MPRVSEVTSALDVRSITDRIFNTPITITAAELWGASPEVRQNTIDRIKPKSQRPVPVNQLQQTQQSYTESASEFSRQSRAHQARKGTLIRVPVTINGK